MVYYAYDYKPNFTLCATDPEAFDAIQVYSPLSFSHGLVIVRQFSVNVPPTYLLFERSSFKEFFVHLIFWTPEECFTFLNT